MVMEIQRGIVQVVLIFLFMLLHGFNAQQEYEITVAEKIYMKFFKKRREEQRLAVKHILELSSYEKKYEIVLLMAEKIFTMMQQNRAKIEASGFIPGIIEFPQDAVTQEILSNILENTVLFSEIVLHLPDISTSVLKLNNNWDILLQWSIAFTKQMRYLFDKGTIKALHLLSQELNYIDRDIGYINPYKNDVKAQKSFEEKSIASKKKVMRKKLKGPRLHSDL